MRYDLCLLSKMTPWKSLRGTETPHRATCLFHKELQPCQRVWRKHKDIGQDA